MNKSTEKEGHRLDLDPGDLTGITEKLYHGITGQKAEGEVQERIQACVEGVVQLYNLDPQLFYATTRALAPVLDEFIGRALNTKGKEYASKMIDEFVNELRK